MPVRHFRWETFVLDLLVFKGFLTVLYTKSTVFPTTIFGKLTLYFPTSIANWHFIWVTNTLFPT